MNYDKLKGDVEYRDGKLYAITKRAKLNPGDVMGYLDTHGYRKVNLYGSCVYEHRLIWELHNGPIPKGLFIDHINGVRNDNRIENLRIASGRDNVANSGGQINRKSIFKGVKWDPIHYRWRVFYRGVEGRKQISCTLRSEIEAAVYYNKLVAEHSPVFGRLNYIPLEPIVSVGDMVLITHTGYGVKSINRTPYLVTSSDHLGFILDGGDRGTLHKSLIDIVCVLPR